VEKRLKIGTLTIHPSLLESTSAATPNGSISLATAITVEETLGGGEVKEYGDSPSNIPVTRADFVQRARDLYNDIAQWVANENAIEVRATASLTAPTVKPTIPAP
jgi:hypothetical protein